MFLNQVRRRKVRYREIRRHLPAVAELFTLSVVSAFLIGQSPQPNPLRAISDTSTHLDWSYRKDVREVYFLFSASLHGKFVPNLTAEGISVLDDGSAPEKMLAFRSQDDVPLRMGLLIDTSPSV